MMNHQCGLLIAVFLAIISLLPADGQIIRWGNCKTQGVTVQQNFTTDQYLGRWYEQQRYWALPEVGLTCVTAEYSPHHDGGINVNNTGIKNGQVSSIIGTGYAPDPDVPAKLMVKFPGAGPAGSMWIVGTDYVSFSVVYSCTDLGPFRLVAAWLLSRDRAGFPHDALENIERILRTNDIEKDPFQPVVQYECPNGAVKRI